MALYLFVPRSQIAFAIARLCKNRRRRRNLERKRSRKGEEGAKWRSRESSDKECRRVAGKGRERGKRGNYQRQFTSLQPSLPLCSFPLRIPEIVRLHHWQCNAKHSKPLQVNWNATPSGPTIYEVRIDKNVAQEAKVICWMETRWTTGGRQSEKKHGNFCGCPLTNSLQRISFYLSIDRKRPSTS